MQATSCPMARVTETRREEEDRSCRYTYMYVDHVPPCTAATTAPPLACVRDKSRCLYPYPYPVVLPSMHCRQPSRPSSHLALSGDWWTGTAEVERSGASEEIEVRRESKNKVRS